MVIRLNKVLDNRLPGFTSEQFMRFIGIEKILKVNAGKLEYSSDNDFIYDIFSESCSHKDKTKDLVGFSDKITRVQLEEGVEENIGITGAKYWTRERKFKHYRELTGKYLAEGIPLSIGVPVVAGVGLLFSSLAIGAVVTAPTVSGGGVQAAFLGGLFGFVGGLSLLSLGSIYALGEGFANGIERPLGSKVKSLWFNDVVNPLRNKIRSYRGDSAKVLGDEGRYSNGRFVKDVFYNLSAVVPRSITYTSYSLVVGPSRVAKGLYFLAKTVGYGVGSRFEKSE